MVATKKESGKKSTPSKHSAKNNPPLQPQELEELAHIHEHDTFARAIFALPEVYMEFFDRHLSDGMKKLIDMSTLDTVPPDSLNPSGRPRRGDLIYQAQLISGNGVFLGFVEHQSQAYKHMLFRASEYLLGSVQKYKQKHPNIAVLPHTIVLYHNREPYRYPTDLLEGLNEEERRAAQESLSGFSLVDVAQHCCEAPLAQSMLEVAYVLFHHSRDPRIGPTLERLWPRFRHLQKQKNGSVFVERALQYATTRSHKDERHGILRSAVEKLDPELQEGIMRTWQALRQEGRLEGRQEGRQEGFEQTALGMLQEGMGLEVIARITHLSMERLRELAQKLEHKLATRKR